MVCITLDFINNPTKQTRKKFISMHRFEEGTHSVLYNHVALIPVPDGLLDTPKNVLEHIINLVEKKSLLLNIVPGEDVGHCIDIIFESGVVWMNGIRLDIIKIDPSSNIGWKGSVYKCSSE